MLEEITRVCEAATRGNLEPRILGSSHDQALQRIAECINSLLDSTDVYVRESTAALQAASDGRYFRRVLCRGMQGTFRVGAELLNESLRDMKSQKEQLTEAEMERVAIVKELEQTLVDSAERISTAIKAISAITKGTHVLALNAKIEAARAGDAGRGFAIVAHEVEETSHRVNHVMAEIDKAFAEFKVETHQVLQQVIDRQAA